jgi:hypothetical protein
MDDILRSLANSHSNPPPSTNPTLSSIEEVFINNNLTDADSNSRSDSIKSSNPDPFHGFLHGFGPSTTGPSSGSATPLGSAAQSSLLLPNNPLAHAAARISTPWLSNASSTTTPSAANNVRNSGVVDQGALWGALAGSNGFNLMFSPTAASRSPLPQQTTSAAASAISSPITIQSPILSVNSPMLAQHLLSRSQQASPQHRPNNPNPFSNNTSTETVDLTTDSPPSITSSSDAIDLTSDDLLLGQLRSFENTIQASDLMSSVLGKRKAPETGFRHHERAQGLPFSTLPHNPLAAAAIGGNPLLHKPNAIASALHQSYQPIVRSPSQSASPQIVAKLPSLGLQPGSNPALNSSIASAFKASAMLPNNPLFRAFSPNIKQEDLAKFMPRAVIPNQNQQTSTSSPQTPPSTTPSISKPSSKTADVVDLTADEDVVDLEDTVKLEEEKLKSKHRNEVVCYGVLHTIVEGFNPTAYAEAVGECRELKVKLVPEASSVKGIYTLRVVTVNEKRIPVSFMPSPWYCCFIYLTSL